MFIKYDQEADKNWHIILYHTEQLKDDKRTKPFREKPTVELASQLAQDLGYDCFEIIEEAYLIERYAIDLSDKYK